jgi:hypothetical protein
MKQRDCSVAGPNQITNERDDSLEIHVSPQGDENALDGIRLPGNKHGITIVLIRDPVDRVPPIFRKHKDILNLVVGACELAYDIL